MIGARVKFFYLCKINWNSSLNIACLIYDLDIDKRSCAYASILQLSGTIGYDT